MSNKIVIKRVRVRKGRKTFRVRRYKFVFQALSPYFSLTAEAKEARAAKAARKAVKRAEFRALSSRRSLGRARVVADARAAKAASLKRKAEKAKRERRRASKANEALWANVGWRVRQHEAVKTASRRIEIQCPIVLLVKEMIAEHTRKRKLAKRQLGLEAAASYAARRAESQAAKAEKAERRAKYWENQEKAAAERRAKAAADRKARQEHRELMSTREGRRLFHFAKDRGITLQEAAAMIERIKAREAEEKAKRMLSAKADRLAARNARRGRDPRKSWSDFKAKWETENSRKRVQVSYENKLHAYWRRVDKWHGTALMGASKSAQVAG